MIFHQCDQFAIIADLSIFFRILICLPFQCCHLKLVIRTMQSTLFHCNFHRNYLLEIFYRAGKWTQNHDVFCIFSCNLELSLSDPPRNFFKKSNEFLQEITRRVTEAQQKSVRKEWKNIMILGSHPGPDKLLQEIVMMKIAMELSAYLA